MAYPTVSGPYGLKPVNLIGGQQFAGSTRKLPIQYGYASNIFYGDFVNLSRGSIGRQAVTSAGASGLVGIFLGCAYTDPVTKQKRYTQNWVAGILAGDALAVVTDDPDTMFKAAVCSATTVIGSGNYALVGQNLQMLDNAGNLNTGNSLNAIAAVTATPATTSTFPVRVMGLVTETAFPTSATGSSSTTTITLTGTGLPNAIIAGADVAYIAANGQVVETGSFVVSNYAAGTTSITINQAVAVPGGITAIPAASTIVFTQYPELYVKLNFGQHAYYAGLASA